MSNLEQRQKRIEALLAANCLTYEEIGRRVGVSKQRIGQVAKKIQLDGHARRHSCVVAQMSSIAEEQKRKGLMGLIIRDIPERYSFETVPLKTQLKRYSVHRTLVTINGYRCTIRRATLRDEYPTPLLQIHGFLKSNADFGLYYNDDHNVWVVVPRSECTKSSTMFSIDRRWRGGGKDWMPFVNAWHLLEKKAA